jgi:hypothetical protein
MQFLSSFPKGGYMKSPLSVLFGAMFIFCSSYLPNSTLAQDEPSAEMPTDPEMMPEDPEMMPEDEAPPPEAMPGDDGEAPPTGEGEDIPADNVPAADKK